MSTITRPAATQSPQERMAFLQLANQVKRERRELRHDLRKGLQSLADVIADPPDCVLSLSIGELLMWSPGQGRGYVGRLLLRLRISPYTEVVDLTGAEWRAIRANVAVSRAARR